LAKAVDFPGSASRSWVARSRPRRAPELDGAAFLAGQRAALAQALSRGLEAAAR
jgi:hypothetical protein